MKTFPLKIFGSKFGIPLIILLLWLLTEPFVPSVLKVYWVYGYFLILLLSLYLINTSGKLLTFYCVIVLLIFVMARFEIRTGMLIFKQINLVLEIFFSAMASINIIWYTADLEKSSSISDSLVGAVLGFFILGGCFAAIFYGICYFDPDIVHFSAISKDIAAKGYVGSLPAAEDLLYLSYITITTCGYGDIYPVSTIARRLCSIEACTGSLYLAIFIGRIFVVYQQNRSRKDPADGS